MNIIDNSLLEAPTVGKLITEKKKLHLMLCQLSLRRLNCRTQYQRLK